jgi:hypothetical protein
VENLSDNEQEILKLLIYESKVSASFSVPRMIWIAIAFVFLSLLSEIAQEFVQRL